MFSSLRPDLLDWRPAQKEQAKGPVSGSGVGAHWSFRWSPPTELRPSNLGESAVLIHGDDDLSTSMSLRETAEPFGGLAQSMAAVDDRRRFLRLEEPTQG